MSKNSDLVSVIMAVYNCEDCVSRSIDSILNQTYTNWEFIICDDCSTDNTYKILEQYREKYPDKITLVKNEKNSKLSYSLNHCLKYAKGTFVARMDADDISKPERFKKQIDFLKSNPEISLVGTTMKVFNGNVVDGVRTYKYEPTKFDLRFNSCFAHATIMTYKSVYDSLGGYLVSRRTQRGQDFDLWFRFFAKGYRGVNLPDPLYVITEDKNAFKRKKYRYRFYATLTALNGYRLVKMPIYYYPFAFKPLISGLIPANLKKRLRKKNR